MTMMTTITIIIIISRITSVIFSLARGHHLCVRSRSWGADEGCKKEACHWKVCLDRQWWLGGPGTGLQGQRGRGARVYLHECVRACGQRVGWCVHEVKMGDKLGWRKQGKMRSEWRAIWFSLQWWQESFFTCTLPQPPVLPSLLHQRKVTGGGVPGRYRVQRPLQMATPRNSSQMRAHQTLLMSARQTGRVRHAGPCDADPGHTSRGSYISSALSCAQLIVPSRAGSSACLLLNPKIAGRPIWLGSLGWVSLGHGVLGRRQVACFWVCESILCVCVRECN